MFLTWRAYFSKHFLCEHISHQSEIMSHSCRLLCGFLMSCIGWTGIIIATSTNDWVVTCKYGMHTCRKMDELETKGLWTECVISTALYHCISLNQILDIPGEKQFFRKNNCLYASFFSSSFFFIHVIKSIQHSVFHWSHLNAFFLLFFPEYYLRHSKS